MGSRADFYVGIGPSAEWLGSIAFDGYPYGNPCDLIKTKTEAAFREGVKALAQTCEHHFTAPEQGWPWPWNNGHLTDYSYFFVDGTVKASCFGHSLFDPTTDDEEGDDGAKLEGVFPDMKDRKNVAFGDRSGMILIGRKEEEATPPP